MMQLKPEKTTRKRQKEVAGYARDTDTWHDRSGRVAKPCFDTVIFEKNQKTTWMAAFDGEYRHDILYSGVYSANLIHRRRSSDINSFDKMQLQNVTEATKKRRDLKMKQIASGDTKG